MRTDDRGAATNDTPSGAAPGSGEFIAFWLRDETVTAAMNVDVWDVNDTLRGLVSRRVSPDRLRDEEVPLEGL
jgi:3-phenylpropionate/trans-cinnamate dioxygenase ferredoxin reductase subunit